jgi:hypothetical protein
MGRTPALIAISIATGCPSPAHHVTDAAIAVDGPPDVALPADADLVDYSVTGEYLDWDSTTLVPCPIVGATWTVTYDNTRVATTDSTGSFTISLTSYYVEMDVEPPSVATTCTTPQSQYDLRAHAIVPPAVHYAGGHFVARSLTADRVSTFYAAIGSAFDVTRGNLLVHIDGPQRAVSITSPHAAEQAFDGSQWSAGATGTDVYFPNIDLSGGAATTVTVAGSAIGAGSVTLVAGKIFLMTVITN